MNVVRLLFNILIWFLTRLPLSPVPHFIDYYLSKGTQVTKILAYVNYFVPINQMLDILGLWSATMILVWVFYIVRAILNK